MHLERIENPLWDEEKQKLFQSVPPGTFNLSNPRLGDMLGGEWYQVIDNQQIIGYAWFVEIEEESDSIEGEIILCEKYRNRKGYGKYTLDELERIAATCGKRWLCATVEGENPRRIIIITWLYSKGYTPYPHTMLTPAEVYCISRKGDRIGFRKELT